MKTCLDNYLVSSKDSPDTTIRLNHNNPQKSLTLWFTTGSSRESSSFHDTQDMLQAVRLTPSATEP